MPWASDKQRRWAHANNKPWAKEWDRKYATGGKVMPGLMDNIDEDITITRKMKDGSSMTMKSPQGSKALNGLLGGQVPGRAPTPVADNQTINVTPGEFVVNVPAAQKHRGLLEQINNDGRQMLAMGGWTKNMKRPGYALGGPFAGYGNYNPQQFQREAQTLNTPGAQRPPPSIQQRIDQGQAFQSQGPNPQQGLPMPQQQAAPPPAAQPAPAPAPMPQKHQALASAAKPLLDIVKGAKSKEDVFGNLEMAIDKAESKRDSMMLIAGSLSLLNGDGIQGALGVAEKFGQLSSTKLNELYNDRERILADAKAKALQQDKLSQIREQNKYRASGTGTGSGGVSGANLTATLQKRVGSLVDSSVEQNNTADELDLVIRDLNKNPGTAGKVGELSEEMKKLLGTQDEISTWKANFDRIITTSFVNNLPPGVASDKDIELVQRGFPTKNWNTAEIKRWVKAYQNMLRYKADQDAYRASYIEENGVQTGWNEGFNNDPNSSKWFGGTSPSTTSSPSSAPPETFDYDFSL